MLWVKAFHIVFVASWFAGLFYLPRIFVNLAMEAEPAARARLLLMARKLYRFMTLLAVPAVLLGLWLWAAGFGVTGKWIYAKLVVVVVIVGYHHACGRLLGKFERGESGRSQRWYRWFNEVPVVLLLVAVVLAVVKPF